MLKRAFLAAGCLALLAGCASPGQQRRSARAELAERVLERAGSRADPGRVAATDFAFARMARDQGQWTAFREYAAPGAQMFAGGSAIDAEEWLAGRPDPAQAIEWAPREVWSSCDGSLAVSFGRYRDAEGLFGHYATVWQRLRDGSYKWTYDVGTPQVPQPAPRAPDVEPDEDTIIVDALQAITAHTADCEQRKPGQGRTEAPAEEASQVLTRARDGTLAWRMEQTGPESWRMIVEWQRDGQWQEALAFGIPDRQG
tara:strand:- start:24967 stop:25734 length:768 start_codon:yes stop_codon:yes gene_type:complete